MSVIPASSLTIAREPMRGAARGRLPRALKWALLVVAAPGAVGAQGPAIGPDGHTVSWSTSGPEKGGIRPGGRAVLVLRGAVRDGWHVYALKQPPGGPTPLRVVLDPTELATASGAPGGSVPVTVFEPAFGLKTPYYTRDFTLTVPVRLSVRAPAGRQLIPVSVRFQTCNGQTCEPPKTAHLLAPVTIIAGS